MTTKNTAGSASSLLAEGEYGEEDEPGEAHGMPVPGGGVNGDLAEFDALEAAEGQEADGEGEQAEEQVGGVDAGDQVEEIAGRSGVVSEGEALRGKLAPRGPLTSEKEEAEGERGSDPGKGAADGGTTEAEPLFEHVDLVKDVAARNFDSQTAEQEYGGVEKENGR